MQGIMPLAITAAPIKTVGELYGEPTSWMIPTPGALDASADEDAKGLQRLAQIMWELATQVSKLVQEYLADEAPGESTHATTLTAAMNL